MKLVFKKQRNYNRLKVKRKMFIVESPVLKASLHIVMKTSFD